MFLLSSCGVQSIAKAITQGKPGRRGEHDAGEDLRFGRLPQGVAIRARRLEQIA